MPELTINNFKGMNLDEHKWQEGYAKYCSGLDIFGLAKNPSKISFPGVLQGIFSTSAGSQAAGVSAITELVLDFTKYSGSDYGIGHNSTAGRIYRRTGSAVWTWVSAITVSSCTDPAAGLEVYGANMYYAQKQYLGEYDNTNGNANFQTFSAGGTTPRKMKVFAGNLYGTDGRYIWKYDGTTFTGAALTLAADFTAKRIEVVGDRLYIMADNGNFSRLHIWDGVSNTYETFADLLEETTAPKLKVAGGILWIVAVRGLSTPGTPIYTFTGSSFRKEITLPLGIQENTGLTEYAGGLMVGSSDDVTAGYESGIAGAWLINKHSGDYPYYAVLGFILRDQLTNKTIGAITPAYIAAQDVTNSSYEIFEIQGSGVTATNNIWQSLSIDAGSTKTKQWHGIKINLETLASAQTVVIKYRLDDATSFTTLKTFTGAGGSNETAQTFIPIGRTSRTIDIRLELTASSGETTRIHSFTLDYTVNGD